MSDAVFLAALSIVFGSFVLMSIAKVIRQYLENRGQRNAAALPKGIQERLERIEAAVDTTAIEVERIAEANRYMTKLLGERAAEAKQLP